MIMKTIQKTKKLSEFKNLSKLRNLSLISLMSLISLTTAQAQVRIGQDAEPTKGAVLDLASTVAGYTGGLKLPHINITNLNVIPVGTGVNQFNEAPVPADLKGIVVYNINTTTGVGIYYWDGTKWVKQTTTTDNIEPWYKATTTNPSINNTDNSYLNARVGLGDFSDANPEVKLHLKGASNASSSLTMETSSGMPYLRIINTGSNQTIGNLMFGRSISDGVDKANVSIYATDYENDNKSGQLRFITRQNAQTDAAVRMTIDSVGRVGIGTTAPTAKLDIRGQIRIENTGAPVAERPAAGKVLMAIDIDGFAKWETLPAATTYQVSNGLNPTGTSATHFKLGGSLTENTTISNLLGGTGTTRKMKFEGDGVDAFSVDGETFSVDAANNRVGIGTTEPKYGLHLKHSGTNRSSISLENTGGASGTLGIRSTSPGVNKALGSIVFGGTAANADSSAMITSYKQGSATTRSADLRLQTSGVDRMIIHQDGNIGIGRHPTTDAKLDIDGNIRIRHGAGTGTIGKVLTAIDDFGLAEWKTLPALPATTVTSADNGLGLSSATVQLGGSLTKPTAITNLTATNRMSFTGTGANAFSVDGTTFSVDATGNRVGIGTAAPEEKLHVNGSSYITNDEYVHGRIGVKVPITQRPKAALHIFSDNQPSEDDNDIRVESYGGNTSVILLQSSLGTAANPKSLRTQAENHPDGYYYGGIFSSIIFDSYINGGFNVWKTRINANYLGNNRTSLDLIADEIHLRGSAFVHDTPIAQGSDRRLKTNITPSKYGLSDVMKLNPVNYEMKSNPGVSRIGFIAQDVQPIIPEVVLGKEGDLDNGETLSVAYSEFVPVLTKAIQEQQAEIESLQGEVKAQQSQIELLLKMNELLESRLKALEAAK